MADPLSSTVESFAPSSSLGGPKLFDTTETSNIMGRYQAAASDLEASTMALEMADKQNRFRDAQTQREMQAVENERLKRVWSKEEVEFKDHEDFRKTRNETISLLGSLPVDDNWTGTMAQFTSKNPGALQDEGVKAVIQAKQQEFEMMKRSQLEEKRFEEARKKEIRKQQAPAQMILKGLDVNEEELKNIKDEDGNINMDSLLVLSGVKEREKEERKLTESDRKAQLDSLIKTISTDADVLNFSVFTPDVKKLTGIYDQRIQKVDDLPPEFDPLVTNLRNGSFTVESVQAQARKIATDIEMAKAETYDPNQLSPTAKASIAAAEQVALDAMNARLGLNYAMQERFRKDQQKSGKGATPTGGQTETSQKPQSNQLLDGVSGAAKYINENTTGSKVDTTEE